ncbi:sigma factor-like helix-turn-helix DNA-binding protein [Streptomyces sp. NPDC049906]|uniref:RNA polymerase sigma factor n=1 Tax=Streptomyces sp. NPDC049906 TaxID=3155656 RepID=UPI0034321C38
MTERPRVPARLTGIRAVTFAAFHELHYGLWMRYARVQVGRDAAERVVDRAFQHLRTGWEQALLQESVPRHGWALLKEEVDAWLQARGRGPQLAECLGFDRAVQRLLTDEAGDRFAVLGEEIRLYGAIAELPERQQDVIVLRYVLACTDEETADFLGIETATVHSHLRRARHGLSRKLGIPLDHGDGED